jgi:hypothetical protein
MEQLFIRSLNKRNFAQGFLFFTLCTIVGLYVSFLWSDAEGIGAALRSIQGKYLSLATLCMFADWLFGAARMHIFARHMSPRVTFFDSIRANLATLCVGGITPFQTGGVGHIYIYNRVGVPVSGTMTTGIINFIGTLTFLIVSTGYVVWRAPAFLPKSVAFVSQYSLAMFAIVLCLFVMMVVKPEVLLVLISRIQLPRRRGFKFAAKMLGRLTLKLERGILEHKAFTRMFTGKHKSTWVWCFAFSVGIYMSRFIGGYVIVHALGGNAAFWHVIAVQVVANFITLFAPTPGASGLAESLITGLMKPLLASEAAWLFALLTRFFTTYCGVSVGGIILVSQLSKDLKNERKHVK